MKHILLTGPPRCGKTTLVRSVVARLQVFRLAGFVTEQVIGRHRRRRVGFQAEGLNGGIAVLANIWSTSEIRVGKYGVELDDFERLVNGELRRSADHVDLFVVDEIGKMEVASTQFVELVGQLLDGERPVLATVAIRGGGLISEVKSRKDVELIAVNSTNRDSLVPIITELIRNRAERVQSEPSLGTSVNDRESTVF